MIPVSAQWQEAIRQQFRYQAYLRCRIQVVPPGLVEGLQATSDDTDSASNISKIQNTDGKQPTHYITCEPHRWLLDGTFVAINPGESVDDWWSTPVTSSKILKFYFDKTYSIPGMYFEWDVVNVSYPDSITLRGYDATGSEVQSYSVNSISSATGFVEAPFENVKRVELEIASWSLPNWRARINDIVFGLSVTYDSINNGRVMSAKTTDKSSPLSERLPTHTASTSLRNLDKEFDPSLLSGVSKYLTQKQLAEFQIGFTTKVDPDTGEATVEWTNWLPYWVDTFTIPADSKEVSISYTSRLAYLTQDFLLDPYPGTERTLYDIAELVLQNSAIVLRKEGEIPWQLSEKLKQFKTVAPIPKDAVNSILQLIANAGACWLHSTSLDDHIAISDFFDGDTVQQVDLTSELGDPQISVEKQLYRVSIGLYKYTVAEDNSELSKGEYTLSGRNTLNIEYNCNTATNVTCLVEGATQVSFTPYSSSAVLVVDAAEDGATFTVTVSGKRVDNSISYLETYRDDTVTQGEEVKIDNPFITDAESAKLLSDWIVSWYNRKQSYVASYLGYPELTVGDRIKLDTVYGKNDVTVLSNRINFNGAFSGELEAR